MSAKTWRWVAVAAGALAAALVTASLAAGGGAPASEQERSDLLAAAQRALDAVHTTTIGQAAAAAAAHVRRGEVPLPAADRAATRARAQTVIEDTMVGEAATQQGGLVDRAMTLAEGRGLALGDGREAGEVVLAGGVRGLEVTSLAVDGSHATMSVTGISWERWLEVRLDERRVVPHQAENRAEYQLELDRGSDGQWRVSRWAITSQDT